MVNATDQENLIYEMVWNFLRTFGATNSGPLADLIFSGGSRG
jgi:hypothetical protein